MQWQVCHKAAGASLLKLVENNAGRSVVTVHVTVGSLPEQLHLQLLAIYPATRPSMTFYYDDSVALCLQLSGCSQSCKLEVCSCCEGTTSFHNTHSYMHM